MLAEISAAVTLLAGHSVQDRPINAVRRGDADAPATVLVVGSIHGNETAGHPVVARLRRMQPPAGVQVWTVHSVNPDGVRRGTRQNARGVDLNRNFPRRWVATGRPGDTFYPGRAAGSEPETKAMMRLIRRIKPDVTIWFHQRLRLVTLTPGADPAIVRAYAKRVRLPAKRLPLYRGTATSWQNATLAASTAFVVELAAGKLPAAAVRRHARAVMATVEPAFIGSAARPSIVSSAIPFGAKRKRQMRAYAQRHYGLDTHLLERPRTIVQHYTASSTYSSAFNTFAANQRDPELGELPGVCAHFIIDRDGAIHQLVPLGLMCRHTIGLNHVSIGIEHVGVSDADVMGRRRQLVASLRLTRWLQDRHDIPTRHVIGHAESLSSPFHHERVARLRDRTHGDFARSTMRRYRRML